MSSFIRLIGQINQVMFIFKLVSLVVVSFRGQSRRTNSADALKTKTTLSLKPKKMNSKIADRFKAIRNAFLVPGGAVVCGCKLHAFVNDAGGYCNYGSSGLANLLVLSSNPNVDCSNFFLFSQIQRKLNIWTNFQPEKYTLLAIVS